MIFFGCNLIFPRVSIIILNWNGWKDTIECLESLYRITYPNYDVIVVDNGSEDDSIQKIKEYAEGKIRVDSKFFEYNPGNKPIEVFEVTEDDAKRGEFNRPLYEKYDANRKMILPKNKDNYGFAGGNNVGIKFALSVLNPDYILLLNNDTVVDKEFLTILINAVNNNKKVGVAGPKILYYDYPNIVWFGNGIKKKDSIDSFTYKIPKETNHIDGCAYLVSKNVIQRVGHLNEEYYMYHTMLEYNLRVKRAGFSLIYVDTSKVYHKALLDKSPKPIAVYYKSRNIFLLKTESCNGFLSCAYGILSSILWVSWYFFMIVMRYKSISTLPHLIKGTLDGILWILKRRKIYKQT